MEPLELYAKIQALVQKEANDAIVKYATASKYNIAQVPAHTHNGIDSQQIDASNIKGQLTNAIQSAGEGTSLPIAADNSGKFYYGTDTDTLYRSNGTAWIAIN